MVSTSLIAALAVTVAGLVQADTIQYKTLTFMGCYKSSQGLTFNTTWTYETSGYCQHQCVPLNYTVLATTAQTDCWCGDTMPPNNTLVDTSFCDAQCAGYPNEMCGSSDGSYFSVWNDGIKSKVYNYGASPTDDGSSSTTSTASTSVVTEAGSKVTVTAQASAKNSTGSSGTNKAAIAAGVVVGLIAVAAILGVVFFLFRKKRKQEEKDEAKRQEAISNFVHAGRQSSSGGTSHTDSRLDPSIYARRQSDVSIADNQDYSRRILKVTNA